MTRIQGDSDDSDPAFPQPSAGPSPPRTPPPSPPVVLPPASLSRDHGGSRPGSRRITVVSRRITAGITADHGRDHGGSRRITAGSSLHNAPS